MTTKIEKTREELEVNSQKGTLRSAEQDVVNNRPSDIHSQNKEFLDFLNNLDLFDKSKLILSIKYKIEELEKQLKDGDTKYNAREDFEAIHGDILSTLSAPCGVCGETEEVDRGMCKKCFKKAQDWAGEVLKYQNRTNYEKDISLCKSCGCMTKTKKGYIYICDKCGKDRRSLNLNKSEVNSQEQMGKSEITPMNLSEGTINNRGGDSRANSPHTPDIHSQNKDLIDGDYK